MEDGGLVLVLYMHGEGKNGKQYYANMIKLSFFFHPLITTRIGLKLLQSYLR